MDVAARVGHISDMIATGAPLKKTVEEVVTAIAELYGMTGLVFETRASDLREAVEFVTYGYARESALKIIDDLRSEYYPRDIMRRIYSEKFRISSHGYYVNSEEWLKLTKADPSTDHPAYYLHPEAVNLKRQGEDHWHEADFYRFVVRGASGEELAYIDIGYSVDSKLPSNEVIQGIETLVALSSLAMEAERSRRLSHGADASARSDLLEDVLKIASSIVSERDLRKLSEMLLSSVSSLFGFGKVSLIVYDEADGAFKWMALFGYTDAVRRELTARSVPTDVVLDDLQEIHRIGKSAYFTPFEEMTPGQLAHFISPRSNGSALGTQPRTKDQFGPNDCLAFALHDSSGRIVGVLYPSEARDGKLPAPDTVETLEIFVSLCEVAIENARLSLDREHALRVSSQRTEQLSRILDLASGIMYVRNLDQMLDSLLKTLARLLGIKRMVIGTKYEAERVYKVEAVYGYSAKATEAIKQLPYTIPQIDAILDTSESVPVGSTIKWRKKVGRMTYYMPAEGQKDFPYREEMSYYPEPELLRMPRRGKEFWHELDWMDTFITDKNGKALAYLEIMKPRDDRIPDSETIEVIEIFATLAGIAIENARLFQEHIDSRKNAELYTDILSHDIKNFNQAILGYLDLLRLSADKPEWKSLIEKIAEQVMNTNWLASNVRTMSRVTFGEVELARKDLGAVLIQCEKSMAQYYPMRKISIRHQLAGNQMFTEADDLIWELFTNILTNAVKYDPHEVVEVDISVERKTEATRRFWIVSIADNGLGISDDMKGMVFDRFSKASQKKGSGMGLHIVKTLTTRYGGKVWVDDRVKGDFSKGAVVKVQLPAVD